MASPDRTPVVFDDLEPQQQLFTVRKVDYILTESEQGVFYNSAMLVDQVLRNSRIFATLMTRIMVSPIIDRKTQVAPVLSCVNVTPGTNGSGGPSQVIA